MDHKKLLHTLFFTPGLDGRWGLPVLWRSGPGAAKTAVIAAVARESGLPLEVLSPGERGEGAFGVTPVPFSHVLKTVGEGGKEVETSRTVMTYPAPDWTDKMPKRGVVFVDEMSSAPPALQAPLLGLLHGGVIGSYRLPPGVRLAGAANPTEMAAGGFDLAMSVANRVGHMEWGLFTAEQFGDWLLSGVDQPRELGKADMAEREEARVIAQWDRPWAKNRALVAGFVKRSPEALYKLPAPTDPTASGAFPTFRTWEMAARALTGAEIHKLAADDAASLFGCFIGEAVASEFFEWRSKLDLPDPEDLVDARINWIPDPRRLDITETVLGACTALVLSTKGPARKDRADNLWKLLKHLTDTDALDVAYPHAEKLVVNGLHGKEARPVLQKLEPIMREAGLIRTAGGQ